MALELIYGEDGLIPPQLIGLVFSAIGMVVGSLLSKPEAHLLKPIETIN